MKILESQNAILPNYEVYQHIIDEQARNERHTRRVPGNLEALMTEVVSYLREKPSPLAKQQETGAYSPAVFSRLLEKFREANFSGELAKGEVLSILNLRPTNAALLAAVIEEVEERFTEEEQAKMIDIIIEVLGRDDEPEENGDEAAADDQDAMPSVENGY